MSDASAHPKYGMMDMRFWEIITTALAEKPATLEEACDGLKRTLMGLPQQEVIAFADAYGLIREELNDAYLAAAMEILHGSFSDDGFEYFKEWIISLGPEAYQAARKNPDQLADWVQPGYAYCDGELFGNTISESYEERFGERMPDIPYYSVPMENEDLSAADAARMFPRLVAIAKLRRQDC